MTFQKLIDIHRKDLRGPTPRPDRRNRAHKPRTRQVYHDWASI